jgi:hypothetical protein
LVHREENIKSRGFRRCKKLAILASRQPRVTRSLALMAGQIVPESLIDTFVDQNAHLGTGEQTALRFFERGDGRFARDGRKALQEIFECFATF